jgi:hypothetical protein
MRTSDSVKGWSGGFDFTPVLLATVLIIVVVAAFQLLHSVPGSEHGLFLFEKACPIYNMSK